MVRKAFAATICSSPACSLKCFLLTGYNPESLYRQLLKPRKHLMLHCFFVTAGPMPRYNPEIQGKLQYPP